MRNVLIGGLITLLGTLLVQILVIPSVQRRTRQRERWEKEVGELLNLIEVDLPTHLESLRLSWMRLLTNRRILDEKGRETFDMERVQTELLTPLQLKAGEAYESLSAVISRAILLQRRVSRMYPKATEWEGLELVLPGLNTFLWSLDPQRFGGEAAPTDEEHQEDYKRFKVHGVLALALIKFVSDPMMPPSTRKWNRIRRWLQARLRHTKSRDDQAAPPVIHGPTN